MKNFFNALTCLLVAGTMLALCACGADTGKTKTTSAVDGTTTGAPEETTAEAAAAETTTKAPANMFEKGVWAAGIGGKVDTYFIFFNEKEGRTQRADGTGGVGFTCEQSGLNVIFHFGSADDVTKAEFSSTENTGTFYYGDKTVTYTFEPIDDDADTFRVPGIKADTPKAG
ncbi:MAG: hypothetical protein IJU45_04980 [Clostridia bacterium]|nr:hypothetical protein [Clostridia bacterium]